MVVQTAVPFMGNLLVQSWAMDRFTGLVGFLIVCVVGCLLGVPALLRDLIRCSYDEMTNDERRGGKKYLVHALEERAKKGTKKPKKHRGVLTGPSTQLSSWAQASKVPTWEQTITEVDPK